MESDEESTALQEGSCQMSDDQPLPGTSQQSQATQEAQENPWPFIDKFFQFISANHSQTQNYLNLKYKCKLCPGVGTKLSAQSNSLTNLKKHIERRHPSSVKDFEEQSKSRSKNKSGVTQPSIKGFCGSSFVSQKRVNSKIAAFIIKSGQPFTIVNNDSFKDLIETLRPDKRVPNYRTLMKEVSEQYEVMIEDTKAQLGRSKYVCTTADGWKEGRRSFLGVTAHILDEDLNRHSFAIACRRMKGRQTYDVLAQALEEIHTEFNIQYKVLGTITDNGTNFCKAFQVFGEIIIEKNDEEGLDEDDDLEFEDLSALLEETPENNLYHLPQHFRCAAHSLNLVVSKDSEQAMTISPTFARLSRSVFGKCQALWNKQGRTTHFSDLVQEKYQLYFVVPNDTRWNSVFKSMERVQLFLTSSTEKFNTLLAQLNLPPLSNAEQSFIKEYCNTMKPVAQALDILQGERGIYMGYLLPTITRLKEKLETASETSLHCKPLTKSLLEGLEKRFSSCFDDRRAIVSAACLPCFKLDWVDNAEKEQAREYLLEEMKLFEITAQDREDSAGDADFFFPKKRKVSQTAEEELSRFLNDPSAEKECLNHYPLIRQVFLKYNTLFPSSASCERLFSHGKFIFRKNRHSLKDKSFEMQLLMHINNAWK